MTRLCLTAIIVVTVHVVHAPLAQACSCLPIDDVRGAVRAADAAFVGVYLRRDDPQGADASTARKVANYFVVETDLKGNLGDRVRVVAPAWEASCGLEVAGNRRTDGRRTGLLLDREEGRWTSSLCAQLAPERFEALGEGVPGPPETSWSMILATVAVIAALVVVMGWRFGRPGRRTS